MKHTSDSTSQRPEAIQQSSEALKPAYVFAENTSADDSKPMVVQPAKVLSQDQPIQLTQSEDSDQEISLDFSDLPAQKSPKKWLFYLFAAVLFAASAELVLFVYAAIEQMDWLAGIWLVIFGTSVLLAVQVVVKEYRGLKQLKRQKDVRQQSESLADSAVIGLAEQHCLSIAKDLPKHYQVLVAEWRDSCDPHYSDSEVLALFEHKVLAPIDKLAMKQVSNNASAASVMIAVSPFALLDMLIVLWRNIHMMNQISQIYGLKLGYFSRVRLIRKIFHTMVYAGAGEILSDAGNYALSAGVTGKLSTRVAQGLGAGILTARIGLKAINESRPSPWLVEKRPSLSTISKQLLTDLSRQIR